MSGIEFVIFAAGGLLMLFVLGVPVFIAFLICNVIGMYVLIGPHGIGLFTNSLYETATTTALVTIPLFLLIGELLFRGGAVDVLFRSIDRVIPRLPGRQYFLTIALSTVFGALSGTAMGVAAMLGRSVMPMAGRQSYDVKLTAGAILAGASLAPIIPPSVLVIIVGTLAGVSISGLLLAGILPGLLLATLFAGYVGLRMVLNPSLNPRQDPSYNETSVIWHELLRLAPFSAIFLAILGLIVAGVATPSEAAATGVVGTLFVVWIYGGLNWQVIWQSLKSASMIAAMILLVMACSKMFAQLMAFSGGTAAMTNFVATLGYSPFVMLVLLMAFPFILCMFIDQIALMLLIIPIYAPLVLELGYDPIWFWILFLINITVGGMTPPFGYTIFALKGASPTTPLGTLYAASWPFVGVFLFGMLLLALFPTLVTLIPTIAKG